MTSTMAAMSGRGVKYWPAPPLTSAAFFFEEALVGVALEIGVEGSPRFLVDEIDDEPAELGRVLDFVLRLAEDDAEHAGTLAEFLEDVAVERFEVVPVDFHERRPIESLRNGRQLVERRAALLVRHLEEE
jgi:hypothetical protein